MPTHVCIRSDNTSSQANNSLVGEFLAHLAVATHFETCALLCLVVGHTHEQIDLVSGILFASVFTRSGIQCPEEPATMIEAAMA